MHKRIAHIIILLITVFSFTKTNAQVAMPDTVCVGVSRVYQVQGSSPLSTYTWTIEGTRQTATSNQMNVTWNTAGIFLVTVQEHSPSGCDGELRSGLVYVQQKATVNAGPDITVCFGSTAQLNGSGGNQWSPSTYLSNSNILNPVATIPAAGVYQYVLNSSNNICQLSLSDTVLITVLPKAEVFAGNDTIVGINQPLQLNAVDVNKTGFTNYTWSPAPGLNDWTVPNPTATITKDITYLVTASTANGCSAHDEITIKLARVADIYVPTAFAPGGVNKLLHAIPVGIKEFRYFAIYNRYGVLVFKTSNPAEGWDGIYKGVLQNTAGFVWMAEGVGYNGRVITKKGNVVLVR